MTPFPLTSTLSSRAVNQCLSSIVYVQFGTPEMAIKVKHQKDDETTGNWEPKWRYQNPSYYLAMNVLFAGLL